MVRRLSGVQEAVQLQRCVLFFVESRGIMDKTGLCFLLNVCIYMGSIGFLHYVLQPATTSLLELGFQGTSGGADGGGNTLSALWAGAAGSRITRLPAMLFDALWLFPMYILSCLVNCIWYSDIAKMAVETKRERARKQRILEGKADSAGASAGDQRRVSLPHFLAQEIYKLLLFAIFFLQVTALSAIPYIGGLLYFALCSLLYAFYCFDYKWGLDSTSLGQRVAVIESNAAFFMGFGGPCVLFSMVLPFYIGIGLVNFLYPLFVLVACDSDIKAATAPGRRIAPMIRVPLFRAAQWQSDFVIKHVGPFRRMARQ
eukprot:jgi/Tetstr1/426150/TSEL_016477.t1